MKNHIALHLTLVFIILKFVIYTRFQDKKIVGQLDNSRRGSAPLLNAGLATTNLVQRSQ